MTQPIRGALPLAGVLAFGELDEVAMAKTLQYPARSSRRQSISISDFFTALVSRIESHNTMTWAASLSFYTSLSLAPLLMLFVTISAQFDPNLQTNFLSQVQGLVGTDAARGISLIIENAKARPDLASVSGLVGTVTLLLSASLVFGELRAALNGIFEERPAPPPETTFLNSIFIFLKERVFQMGLVFGFIFTMLVSLGVSTAISSMVGSGEATALSLVNIAISAALYMGIFTLLFRFIPKRHLPWRQAARGGVLTALLFVSGKELIGLYLGNSAISSAYGAAGSIIVLLAWVYYSALITFIGAHVSQLFPVEERA